MPLHGDIIEGIAEDANDELLFVKAKGRSDFSLQLGKISRRREDLWLKVRRGENVLKLRVCVVPERSSKLQKKFTFRAASSDKHVVVLADLTFDQCCELQGNYFHFFLLLYFFHIFFYCKHNELIKNL